MLRSWLHSGAMPGGNRRRWRRLVLSRFPGETTGDGGGGGVSAPPSSGSGGGGGGSTAPPSSGDFSNAPYSPGSNRDGSDSIQPSGDILPIPPALQGALDGTGPGYAVNRQQPGTPGPYTPAQAPQQGQPTDAWSGLRETLTKFGVPLPENITPEQGYAQIAQAMQGARERNYYTDLGASIAPEYEQYQAWKAQQAPAQAPAQEEGPWNPPPMDKSWLTVCEKDPETGRIRSKQGYNPAYGDAVQAHFDYIEQAQTDFFTNPRDFILKMIGGDLEQRAADVVAQRFGHVQEQQQISNLLETHKSWLWQYDQNGNPVKSPSGKNMFSPNGARYNHYIQYAFKELGLPTIQAQNDYAIAMLERDAYKSQVAQPAVNQNPARQMVPGANPIPPGAGHNPNVNSLQSMVQAGRQGVQPTVEEPSVGQSFHEMLRQGFQAEQVTDQDIRNSFGINRNNY